jgi:hypothetical protein
MSAVRRIRVGVETARSAFWQRGRELPPPWAHAVHVARSTKNNGAAVSRCGDGGRVSLKLPLSIDQCNWSAVCLAAWKPSMKIFLFLCLCVCVCVCVCVCSRSPWLHSRVRRGRSELGGHCRLYQKRLYFFLNLSSTLKYIGLWQSALHLAPVQNN